ncbi:MAG TPA: hypothetical protein VI072_02305 [Polyangiaceae bacterium]
MLRLFRSFSGARPPHVAVTASAVCGALLLAFAPLVGLRGFMVDDALIIARVAHHVATGFGHRFNATGPVVDAVTPLGWPYFVAIFAGTSVLRAFVAAKWLGAASYLLAVSWLARALCRLPGRAARFAPLLLLGCSAPLAAWAASGMETGFIVLLCTLALTSHRAGAMAAGLAAGLRPELIPWAVVLAFGSAVARRERPLGLLLALACALGPALAAAVTRSAIFGQAAPLSSLAKPSDLEHGAVYAIGAAFGTGALPLLCALRGYWRVDGHTRAVALSVGAHFIALLLAGGDWMALYRLATPLLPAAIFVASALAAESPLLATGGRVACACALSSFVLMTTGGRAAHVGEHRLTLIERARRPLAAARSVAALDIGWVGAATPAAIVDLAGVTDPAVARLAGGHTSKRVSRDLLERRGVDVLVLLLAKGQPLRRPWWTSQFDRVVERRVATLASELTVRSIELLPLGGTDQQYVVVAVQQ